MEATFWPSLSASGILVLALVIGRAATARLVRGLRSLPLVRACLALVVGVALLTPPLVVSAALGWFRFPWIGLLAWLLAIMAFQLRPRIRQRCRPGMAEVMAIGAAALFAVVAMHGRDETLGAGRDQQVYAEFAIALAQHGAPQVRYPSIQIEDRALLRAGNTRTACHANFFDRWRLPRLATTPFVVPGGTNACDGIEDPIVLLHPWGWPVWLAVAYRMFGLEGIYSANAIVFAVGSVLLFAMIRIFAGSVSAVLATVLFLSLPSSLWIAGVSLSEPFAMTLLLAVPLLATGRPRYGHGIVAAITAAAILIRIDAALLVPIAIAAALATVIARPDQISVWRRFALYQIGCLAFAAGFYVLLFPSYLDAFWSQFLLVIVGSVGLTAIFLVLTPNTTRQLRILARSKTARATAIVALLLLFLYAAAIRPLLAPTAVAGNASMGTHDYREYALLNLAANLSWPVLLAALGGACTSIAKGWGTRSRLLYPLVLFFALGETVLFLAVPGVSPDQPWAFRRFIPVAVPYAMLFAVVFLRVRRSHANRWVFRGASIIMAATMIVSVASLPRGAALVRENAGYTATLSAIAKALPDTLVVATGQLRDVAAALFVAYGKAVAPSNDGIDGFGNDHQLTSWIRAKIAAGHHPWILHGSDFRETGLNLSKQRSWTLRRRFVTPELRAPATMVRSETRRVTLSRVEGFDTGFATRMFGAEPAWGSKEAGFFPTEIADFGMFRYTNGNAWIEIPATALRGCAGLKVDLFTYARRLVHRKVSIMVNNRVAWEGLVATGISTVRVPLVVMPMDAIARIGIISDAADPADMNPNDPRTGLSEGLIGVRPLRSGEPVEAGPGMKGFQSDLSIVGTIPDPVVISLAGRSELILGVRNSGTAYWPAYREHSDPVGVVKIALQWFRHGSPDSLVGNDRWPLSISMLPGDRTRIRVPLKPVALDGRRLPPGDYDLRIAMVREGYALFSDSGGAGLSLSVLITP
ncbi:MAG: hypothetical protein ACYC9Z_01295 [Casimicrobiaceae bacterium]